MYRIETISIFSRRGEPKRICTKLLFCDVLKCNFENKKEGIIIRASSLKSFTTGKLRAKSSGSKVNREWGISLGPYRQQPDEIVEHAEEEAKRPQKCRRWGRFFAWQLNGSTLLLRLLNVSRIFIFPSYFVQLLRKEDFSFSIKTYRG